MTRSSGRPCSNGFAPRDGFFSGYLKNEAATEESWKNGFFHTGDTVIQREDDMFIFVDRSKNIIRRSGENIAAAPPTSGSPTSPCSPCPTSCARRR